MSSPNQTVQPVAFRLSPQANRALKASIIGTLIEWYDYALYGAAAGLVISQLFFPSFLPGTGTMAAFATFAVGFVVRPLGGVIISHIGDKFGRKPAMILTIMLMGGATVAIGLLPSALSIGAWAPILLIVFRCLQGFGAGAELAGAFTLVAEYTPHDKRGYYTGLLNATPAAGTTIATLAFLAVSGLPDDVLLGWAWRLPFLLSAVLFFVALYIRQRLEETPAYTAATEHLEEGASGQKTPIAELFKHSLRSLVAGIMATTGLNATLYILTSFSLAFMTNSAGLSRTEALTAVIVSSLFGIVGSPIGGKISDRIGAGRLLAVGGIAGAVFAFPLFLSMQSGNVWLATAGMSLSQAVTLGACLGSQGKFLTNLFPTRYRFTGVATAREINGAAIAGTTPLIATALISGANGGIWLAALYVVACSLITVLAVVIAKGAGDHETAER